MNTEIIDGDVGPLEIILETPKTSDFSEPEFIAVICHPHPLFQGTMHNKVAYMLARTVLQAGGAVLRFNFRGVGKSEGEHADGIGEVGDAVAAMRYLKKLYPDLPMTLAGFSFGSYVSLRTVQDSDLVDEFSIERLITVAPPVGRWDFSSIEVPTMPYLIVQGDEDDLVDADVVKQWASEMNPAPQFEMVAEADHFFHGKLTVLRDLVFEWLKK